jgi:hypothetical protein
MDQQGMRWGLPLNQVVMRVFRVMSRGLPYKISKGVPSASTQGFKANRRFAESIMEIATTPNRVNRLTEEF